MPREDKASQEAVTDWEGLNIVEMPYAVGRYQTTRYSLGEVNSPNSRKTSVTTSHETYLSSHFGDTQYGDLHQNRALTEYSGCQRLFLHADTPILNIPFIQ